MQQLTQVWEINKIKPAEWSSWSQTRALLGLTSLGLAGWLVGQWDFCALSLKPGNGRVYIDEIH